MELKEAIEKRTSIRDFDFEDVDNDSLREIVRRAGLAPSLDNQQPWKFIVIKNKDLLKKMAIAISKKIEEIPSNESSRSMLIKTQVEMFATFFKDAPAVIALTMHPFETILDKGSKLTPDELNKLRNYPDMQSAGAAVQNILLSAVEMGLGGCWMTSPLTAREELETLMNIEKPYKLISFVALGKPKKDKKPSNKKPLEDIIEVID